MGSPSEIPDLLLEDVDDLPKVFSKHIPFGDI
jgi:hypothetical protein